MNRYVTRRYVAVCWTEAMRLANLDGTSLNSIRCHDNIALLHRTEWWAWWSDERLTTAIGLPPELCPEMLSVDAIALIDNVWLGGAIAPQCGWALLAKVDRILSRERHSCFTGRKIFGCQEKLTVRFSDKKARTLYLCYTHNQGLCQCDILTDSPS
jgi:hypothetical protein